MTQPHSDHSKRALEFCRAAAPDGKPCRRPCVACLAATEHASLASDEEEA